MLTKERKKELVIAWVKAGEGGMIEFSTDEEGDFLLLLDNHDAWIDLLTTALGTLPWNPKFQICQPRYTPVLKDKKGNLTGNSLFFDGKEYWIGVIQIWVDALLQCRHCGNLCFGSSYCSFNIPELAFLEPEQIVEQVLYRVGGAILDYPDAFPGKNFKLLYEKQILSLGLTHGDGCEVCSLLRGSLYAPDSEAIPGKAGV